MTDQSFQPLGLELCGRVCQVRPNGAGYIAAGHAPYWLFYHPRDVHLASLPLDLGARVTFRVGADDSGFYAEDVARTEATR